MSISPERRKSGRTYERNFLVKQEVVGGKVITEVHNNDLLVKHLELIKDGLLSSAPDSAHRARNYIKVINGLKSYPIEVKSVDQLTDFWQVAMLTKGKLHDPKKSTIFLTLCQYIEEGKSVKGHNTVHNPELAVRRDLLRIWGAGATKVDQLRAMGISSIAECRTYVEEEKKQWESKECLGHSSLKSFLKGN